MRALAVVIATLGVAALGLSACRKPPGRALTAAAPTASRTLTFTNQCPFDVWVQSVGSNAANLPCSASSTSAQANCPDGFVCFDASTNTQYCVPGTTNATTLPVTSPSQITLDASACASGQVVTDETSAQWGQCTCGGNADCAANQVCGAIGQGVSQCFWGFTLPDGGHLTAASTAGDTGTIAIAVPTGDTDAIVASGNFFAQLACDANGNCLSDSNQGAPATRIEYTLTNGVDFYDVSYINGMNVPAVMTPVATTGLAYDAADPYRCLAAGGDAATLAAIASFQSQHGLPSNTALQAFACTNAYATTFVGDRQGFNFVSTPTSPVNCASTADCASGQVCGLTLGAVNGKGPVAVGQLTCGQRLGYWSYAQLCAVNSGFASATLGVACDDAETRAYAECTALSGVSDLGPGRSCFNSNTTSPGESCCGFASWSFGGAAQPMAVGASAVANVDTTTWTSDILPVVTPMKTGCPLAYAYQFDDPFATFTCTTSAAPNLVSYDITLCPGGNTGGISPPPPATCTPTVPSGFSADQFTVGAPAGISLAVAACDATGANCTTPVPPSAGTTIFTTTSATIYQLTASSSSTSQVCQFQIPSAGCIARASSAAPPCTSWTIATTGAWVGRSISIPDFAAPGARAR